MTTECLQKKTTFNPLRTGSTRSPRSQLNRLIGAAKQFVDGIRSFIIRHHEQRIDRDAFQTLNALDDTLLKDIGLTKGDVEWANHLPLHINAAVELEKISKRRRQTGDW